MDVRDLESQVKHAVPCLCSSSLTAREDSHTRGLGPPSHRRLPWEGFQGSGRGCLPGHGEPVSWVLCSSSDPRPLTSWVWGPKGSPPTPRLCPGAE